MFRKSGNRFSDKDMRRSKNLSFRNAGEESKPVQISSSYRPRAFERCHQRRHLAGRIEGAHDAAHDRNPRRPAGKNFGDPRRIDAADRQDRNAGGLRYVGKSLAANLGAVARLARRLEGRTGQGIVDKGRVKLLGLRHRVNRHAQDLFGADDLPGSDRIATRRQVHAIGPGKLVGVSIHTVTEAEAIAPAFVDYALAGPAFETASNPGYGPEIGHKGFAEIARTAPVPVLAIGGINAARIGELIAAGAAGVAVMGGVMRATDPAQEVKALIATLKGSLAIRA